MKRAFALIVSLALLLSISTFAFGDELKVGFIYVGPIGDHGWTYQHHQGLLAVEEEFGNHVETIYVENVAEGPDAERAITRLARQGAGLIFTTSFGFMDPTVKVAARFPDVKFEHATGYKRADNVSTYSARFYEGRYIIGQIAAQMSEAGVAGYIASFPIPEVVRGINSFLLGAQTINPDFKLKVIWVNTWFDPGKEADAAKVLIGQGADIITQHTDSTARRCRSPRNRAWSASARPPTCTSSPPTRSSPPSSTSGPPTTLNAPARCWRAPGSPSTPGTASRRAWSACRSTRTCRKRSPRWRARRKR